MASPESFSVLGIEQLSIEKYKNDGKNNSGSCMGLSQTDLGWTG
jgi:hypothetical protein